MIIVSCVSAKTCPTLSKMLSVGGGGFSYLQLLVMKQDFLFLFLEPEYSECLVASWDWTFGQKEATPKNDLGTTTFIFLGESVSFSY